MRGRITNEGEITEAANVELAASVILNSLVLRLWLQNFDFQIGILWHCELAFLVGKPQVWLTFPYICSLPQLDPGYHKSFDLLSRGLVVNGVRPSEATSSAPAP